MSVRTGVVSLAVGLVGTVVVLEGGGQGAAWISAPGEQALPGVVALASCAAQRLPGVTSAAACIAAGRNVVEVTGLMDIGDYWEMSDLTHPQRTSAMTR